MKRTVVTLTQLHLAQYSAPSCCELICKRSPWNEVFRGSLHDLLLHVDYPLEITQKA